MESWAAHTHPKVPKFPPPPPGLHIHYNCSFSSWFSIIPRLKSGELWFSHKQNISLTLAYLRICGLEKLFALCFRTSSTKFLCGAKACSFDSPSGFNSPFLLNGLKVVARRWRGKSYKHEFFGAIGFIIFVRQEFSSNWRGGDVICHSTNRLALWCNRVPSPHQWRRFLRGGDGSFQVVYRTDLEVDLKRTQIKIIAWIYWSYIQAEWFYKYRIRMR